MSSVGLIRESGTDSFAANQVTRILAMKGSQGAILYRFETMGPMFQALPHFSRRTGYQNPTDGNDVVLQQAFQTDLDAYQWLGAHPSNLEWFNQYMSSRRNEAESWLSAYPVKE
ncbi:hypothetical protein MMC18_000388 [Xylographa bjoerkii]|nr:hypothetical protein [Xylographa bjoerkii]